MAFCNLTNTGAKIDPQKVFGYFMMRIPAQVISGIGFLGAGAITIHENRIQGLNTAATIWAVAAIGVLTGLKLIFEACVGAFMIIFTNVFIRKVKKTIAPERFLDDDL